MDDRAATETLGMVLLLALVIILATTIGLGLLTQTSAIQDGTERSYLNIEPDLNTSALTLVHAGGPSFQTSKLTLVLQNDTGRQRYDQADFDLGDQFDTGDRLTVSHNFTGYVDITLYSSETDERLYRAVRSTDQSDISTPSAGSGSPPTARIVALDSVAEGFSISLDGSQSSDPDGNETISSYSWGINGNGSVIVNGSDPANATYKAPTDIDGDENVTVQLTVTDEDGNTDTTTKVIRVVDIDTATAPTSGGEKCGFEDENNNGVYDEGEPLQCKSDLEDDYNDPDGDLVIYPDVGEIKASGGELNITANTITAGNEFRASGDAVTLIAEGDINIDGAVLDADGNAGISVTSKNGTISAVGTTMTANNGPIDLNSNGDIDLQSADLDAGSYTANLGTPTATLYVQDLSLAGNGNNAGTLVYDPDGITVNGTPSQGTVSPT